MANKRIKDLETAITAFRTGDVIPVDGPNGTAKMSKDDLLKETAENAFERNVGKTNYTRSFTDSSYLNSYIRMPILKGDTIVLSLSKWDTNNYADNVVILFVGLSDDGSTNKKSLMQLDKADFDSSDYVEYRFKVDTTANYVIVGTRGNAGETASIWVGQLLSSRITEVREKIDNVYEKAGAITWSTKSVSSSDFDYGNVNSSTGLVIPSSAIMVSKMLDTDGSKKVKVSLDEGYYAKIAQYENGDLTRNFIGISGAAYDGTGNGIVFELSSSCNKVRILFGNVTDSPTFAGSAIGVELGEISIVPLSTDEDVESVKSKMPFDLVDGDSLILDSSLFTSGEIRSDGTSYVTNSVQYSKAFFIPENVSHIYASVGVGYRLTFAFYDSDGQFISRASYGNVSNPLLEEIPTTAKRVRVQYWNTAGTATFAGSEVSSNFKMKQFVDIARKSSVDALQLVNDYYSGDSKVVFRQGSIFSSTGKDAPNTSSWYNKSIRSDYIKVEGEFVVGVVMSSGIDYEIFKYDSDYNYIGNISVNGVCKYITHTGYIRMTIYNSDRSPITPQSVNMDNVVIPKFHDAVINTAHSCETFLPAYGLKSSDVYAFLDKLASEHTHYITDYGVLCRDASDTKDVKYYVLGTGNKKIALVCAQHGPKSDPVDDAITCCNFVRSLCLNEYEKGSYLENLKRNYTILVVPILNPYGFDVFNPYVSDSDTTPGGRNNYNGVNLNRDWTNQSQPEVQACVAKLTAFAPDAVIDLHCTGNLPGEGGYGYQWGWCSDKAKAIAFNAIMNPAHLFDYDIQSSMGYSDDMSTVSGKSLDSWSYLNLHCVGCTCETQFLIAGIDNDLHTSQVESANLSWLVNTIYLCAWAAGVESDFEYELTKPQKRS